MGNERSGEAEATGVASRAGGGCGMKLQSRCGARSRTKREPDSLSDSKRTSEGRASPMMVARGGSVAGRRQSVLEVEENPHFSRNNNNNDDISSSNENIDINSSSSSSSSSAPRHFNRRGDKPNELVFAELHPSFAATPP
ncbi:hypothetical protein AXG93_246s1100 [Marchantia polymorpha subsp. ruderalis]|uniref:Uncharacterized protein n=1 Tax=Marchantia polymorpha subsp. ruderalis TaxID=1480154 RepID=A0A176WAR5_MARPO|nr:hypothetical protein AXG93_246s1100 [Marchantia polymorpha subsp. ruderalis]